MINEGKYMPKTTALGLFFGVIFLAGMSVANEPTAREVMLLVDERDTGESRRQSGRLTLIDEKRKERLRDISQVARRFDNHEKVMTQVTNPAEVKGTTILSYDWDAQGRDDETWLYLPKLSRVKRLASTDQSSYWLGSDFTYADLSGLEVDDFSYEFASIREEDGTWVIDAAPESERRREVESETGYQKIRYWIDQEKNLVSKAKYWLSDGQLVKYFSASDIRQQDGVWVVGKSQMVLTRGERLLHASVFIIKDVIFNIDVPEEAFATNAMEREL